MLSILVRFSQELVALVGDVSKMYHRFALTPEDRPLHRFLQKDLDQRKEPEVYKFIDICVWGGPSCVQYVWQKHADDHKTEYPLAAEVVRKSCYTCMDDLVPSGQQVEMAKEVQKQFTKLVNKAGFDICKWISQRPEVIEDIPATERPAGVDLVKKEFLVSTELKLQTVCIPLEKNS